MLETLLRTLDEVDHLVLLGDVVELLEGRRAKAMAAAEPVLRAIGGALGGRRVTVVPGNHDHALVRPWLREQLAAGAPIAIDARVPAASSRGLADIAGWLAPARVEVRYPGVWLADGVWATHGHYLDRHLLPDLGWAGRPLFGDIPETGAQPGDYEVATGAANVAFAGLSSVSVPRPFGEPLDLALQTAHRVAALSVPVTGFVTRGRLAPLSAGLLGFQFRRTGLPALAEVAARLGVGAEHVVFGHLHRLGPLADDVPEDWAHGGVRLLDTGSWVYEPLILAGATPPHPYWPGGAVLVEDGAPPRTLALLGELD